MYKELSRFLSELKKDTVSVLTLTLNFARPSKPELFPITK